MRRATSHPFPAGSWAGCGCLCGKGMGSPFLNLVSCARNTGAGGPGLPGAHCRAQPGSQCLRAHAPQAFSAAEQPALFC